MERVEAGMMAWSRAGHDKGKLYVILHVEGEFAYLADGRTRPLERPKKKRLKHIQVIRKIPENRKKLQETEMMNEDIKWQIKHFMKESYN